MTYFASLASVVLVVVAGLAAPAAADDPVQLSTQVTAARGGIDKRAALVVIDGEVALAGCFQPAQRRAVNVTLTVKPTGEVAAVKLRGAGKPIKSCLTTELQRLAFPARAKASTIRVTLSAISTEEETAYAYAMALTGEGHAGASEGDMGKRQPGSELGAQIDASSNGGSAVGGGSGRGSRGDGGANIGTGTGAGTGDGAAPRGPSGRISLAAKRATGGHSADVVVRKVLAAYMSGLKRCYKAELETTPTLKGTLVLAFEISSDGRVGTATATGIDALSTCTRDRVTTWRFPTADAATAVELKLQLVPD